MTNHPHYTRPRLISYTYINSNGEKVTSTGFIRTNNNDNEITKL